MNEQSRLALPFDQYSRQMQVVITLNALRSEGQSFSILDVGGYKGATSLLHADDMVTILDVFDVNEPNYIKGNALKMDFADNSFDFVVNFDVFEHIADQDRALFIAETARVARIATIVAAPVRTHENELAENLMNDLFNTMHGKDHPWLVEHIQNGIPAQGQAEAEMQKNGLQTFTLPSNDIQLWLAMQGAIFVGSKYPEMAAQIDALNSRYNKMGPFDGASDDKHSYRSIVIGAPLKKTIAIIQKAIPIRSYSLETKARAEHEITKAYLAAFQTLSISEESLAQKVAGLDHACTQLSEKVHQLEAELVAITSSRSYRMSRKLSVVKNQIKSGKG